jgi:hypothetical protein
MSVLTYTYTDADGHEFITTHESKYDVDLSIAFKEPTKESPEINTETEVINNPEDPTDLEDDQDDVHCQLEPLDEDFEFPDINNKIINNVEPSDPAEPPVANPTIKYAPVVPPVKGDYNLYCIALVWNDNKGASISKVSNAGKETARIYKKLSDGHFNLNVIVKSVKVNFNRNSKNLPAAEKVAKKAAVVGQKNKKPNLYIIVNNGAKGFSNGSGNTAHLLGTLTRDFLHELGHCRPLQLQHSGRMKDGKFESYSDGTSFMSKFSSLELTAAQLYALGWLPENKVALHEFGFPPVEYKIEKLGSSNKGPNLKAVMIPMENNQKPLFLSMPKVNGDDLLALHQPYGGKGGAVGTGTKRLLVFGKAATYAGLSFQKIEETKDYTVVRIGPTTPKPPAP